MRTPLPAIAIAALLAACSDNAVSTASAPVVDAELATIITDREFSEPFVAPQDLLVLGDSLILVADRDQVLVIRTDSAELLRAVGRSGSGPGEFQNIAWLGELPDGGVVVHDWRLKRLTYLSGSLQFESDRTPPGAGERPEVRLFCGLGDGGIAAGQFLPSDYTHQGLTRTTAVLRLYNGDNAVTTLDTVLIQTMWSDYTVSGMTRNVFSVGVPFAPRLATRCARDRMYWADGSSRVVHVASVRERHDIQLQGLTRRPVTAEDIAFEAARHEDEVTRHITTQALEGAPQDSLPLFRDFRVDSYGSLWLLVDQRPATGSSWMVFDSIGHPIATVRLPYDFRLIQVRPGSAWGFRTTELGETEVRRYDFDLPALSRGRP